MTRTPDCDLDDFFTSSAASGAHGASAPSPTSLLYAYRSCALRKVHLRFLRSRMSAWLGLGLGLGLG